MGWTYDGDKVKSQLDEFRTFLNHAKNDEPAGVGDLLGRPFQHPAPAEPDINVQPVSPPQVNLYLLQVAQLYEAGLIDQQQADVIVNNIYD